MLQLSMLVNEISMLVNEKAMDADHDGTVSFEEMQAFMRGR